MKNITVALLLLFFSSISVCEDTYHSEMKLANEALAKKDYPAYLTHMKRAVELGPDKIGRPYFQYGLARAYAYNNQNREAMDTLEVIYKEGIEAPMIFLAEYDPAFQKLKDDRRFIELQKRRETHPIMITSVAGNVFLIEGAGCYLAASIGNDGILLVDTGYPQLASRITEVLNEKLGGKSVKYIINTHEHLDHVGGNGLIGKDVVVIAHSNVRPALQKPSVYFSDFFLPALPEKQWPNLSFTDSLTLHFNGEEVRVVGLPAHSEGDSIIYFSNSHVLNIGDNYFPETRYLYPGTKIEKYFDTLGPFLKSLPDSTVVVSGHAKPVAIAELKQKYDKTDSMYRFVAAQVLEKKSLEEAKNAGEKNGFPFDWLEFYFTNLSKKK